ncbi:methyltransferase domain-containing protein [Gracilibacillus lacisalsi]|uniref:methyltransferase domain-containing protein n=1 Tax=Gracilibacillus lacisalsi TaxID=393087 RepID=UPI0003714514|nr:methyltransferase domain-containing protein [Gracilibacillus lacisalsi]
MDKLKILERIKELYSQNKNIIKYLKELDNKNANSVEDILISYDFQAGSYTKGFKENPTLKVEISKNIANIINNLDDCHSLLEVGVGEATTLGNTLSFLKNKSINAYGYDLSWSRIKFAKSFLNELNIKNVELFTGDLFNSPIKDNSIDIVYTCHSVEPNGGKEKEALKELYRITNKYLILIEPAYELADNMAKARMKEHGYITNLYTSAKELGYDILEYKLLGVSTNPLNPTGVMIIRKEDVEGPNSFQGSPLACPLTKSDISLMNNAYFSEKSLLAYPVIDNIPCLLPQNAIVATKFV